MAVEGDTKELNVHRAGYSRFVRLMAWGGAISVLIGLSWVIFIA